MLRFSQDWLTPWQPLRSRVTGKGCFYLLMRSVPNVSLTVCPSFPAAWQAGGSGELKEQTWHRCHPSPAWRDRSRGGTGPENRKQKLQKLQSVPWRSTLLCLTSSHANILWSVVRRSDGLSKVSNSWWATVTAIQRTTDRLWRRLGPLSVSVALSIYPWILCGPIC